MNTKCSQILCKLSTTSMCSNTKARGICTKFSFLLSLLSNGWTGFNSCSHHKYCFTFIAFHRRLGATSSPLTMRLTSRGRDVLWEYCKIKTISSFFLPLLAEETGFKRYAAASSDFFFRSLQLCGVIYISLFCFIEKVNKNIQILSFQRIKCSDKMCPMVWPNTFIQN